MKLSEYEDGIQDDEKQADVKRHNVAPNHLAELVAYGLGGLDVCGDILTLGVELSVDQARELVLPHHRRVAGDPLQVLARAVLAHAGGITHGVVGPRCEP